MHRFYWLLIPAIILLAGDVLHAQAVSPDGVFRNAIQVAGERTVKIFGASVGSVDGYGTGLIVSDDGRIVTSDGVYLKGSNVRVTMNDGTKHNARILKRDRRLNLALLQIDATTANFFQPGTEPVGKKGDWVLAVSNAFKVAERTEPLSVNMGLITLRTSITARISKRKVAYDGPIILIDAITSNPGAGGGAVVTVDGKLVGMIGKVIESNETSTRLNYAIPQEEIYAFLNGTRPKPAIVKQSAGQAEDPGIRLFRLDGNKSPAYVDRVNRGSAAHTAGIRSDDLIISIGGESISNVAEYKEVVKTLVPGETTVIVVKRRRKLVRIEIVPVEKK